MRNPILQLTIYYFVATISSSSAMAADVTIDQNTTIDAGSSISSFGIRVIDGPDGPTSVGIVSGGTIAGFNGEENSVITLDGGTVTYLSLIQDNATFVLKDGELECTELICSLIDYSSLLRAYDSSTLHFFGGGTLDGIELNDSSVAHVYGQALSLVTVDHIGVYVEGSYANGEPVDLSFHFRTDIAERVILHNIPEPGAALAILAIAWALLKGAVSRGRSARQSPLLDPSV